MPPFGVRRTHHVHLCEIGGRLWERLLFRDYLGCHPEDRAAYADLKNRLAAEHRDDREAYTRGKGALRISGSRWLGASNMASGTLSMSEHGIQDEIDSDERLARTLGESAQTTLY